MSRDDYSMIPTCIFRSNQGVKTQVEGNQPRGVPHCHGRYGFNALTREGDWEVIFKNYACALF